MMSILQGELGSDKVQMVLLVAEWFLHVCLNFLSEKCERVKKNHIKIKGWNLEDETWETLQHLLP